ncbi:MAG: sugar ABC transporter permease, partial [Chloroflexi bacterium]|nr:sugar ABC transporter permease [Chloroflexota bacterium]
MATMSSTSLSSTSTQVGQAHDSVMKRVFLSPAVAILLGLSIFPLLWSLGTSFTDIQRGGITRAADGEIVQEASGFLGLGFNLTLDNYTRMIEDERLHATVRNTLFFVVAGVSLQFAVGFGLALVLNQPFFGRNLVRVIFLMPMMMTPVAAAYTGRMMFDSTISPLAQFQRTLSSFFGTQIAIPWLTDGTWAPITIVLIDSWQWIPFMTLLLLAGMQAIPEEVYEAA